MAVWGEGGSLNNIGGNNDSTLTTGTFVAAAGETLEFLFDYVKSEGGNFANYG